MRRKFCDCYVKGRLTKRSLRIFQISTRTVDRYRQSLMVKLDLQSRAELVKYAIRKGLIDSDS